MKQHLFNLTTTLSLLLLLSISLLWLAPSGSSHRLAYRHLTGRQWLLTLLTAILPLTWLTRRHRSHSFPLSPTTSQPSPPPPSLVITHSSFLRHSDLVIRHFFL
ncbi:MAG TPA: hypothetical protein VFE58_13325 [Tepidisphaeraceae bacterium]|nr:hypothetical protein [Tepidisphaeraceae bacterium]